VRGASLEHRETWLPATAALHLRSTAGQGRAGPEGSLEGWGDGCKSETQAATYF